MDDTARLGRTILGVWIAVALVSSLVGVLLLEQTWGALCLNIGTELAGAWLTYLILERVIERREEKEVERRTLEEKKAALIKQMGSGVRDVAIAAAEELQWHGWLQDGSLQDAHLVDAKLSGAILVGADLRGAVLFEANLSGANLSGADLRGADLSRTILNGARVTDEQLAKAVSLEAGIMPDGIKHN